jgi:thiol-disulfide isomerase/thioredoxin
MKVLTAFVLGILYIFNVNAQDIDIVKAPELVKQYEAGSGVMVINFWSTWCKPCIEEIPHFIKVYEDLKNKGVELWLVSQDTKELYQSGKLKSYIKGKEGWGKAKLYWFDETNADYYCPIIDKAWSGVIPATLIINPKKGYRKFIEESMSAEALINEIGKAL